jgi:hypothetical protein
VRSGAATGFLDREAVGESAAMGSSGRPPPPPARSTYFRSACQLKGKRDTLLRLLARAGIALTENESARIHACVDIATLDRWIDNVLGAKTATEVLS